METSSHGSERKYCTTKKLPFYFISLVSCQFALKKCYFLTWIGSVIHLPLLRFPSHVHVEAVTDIIHSQNLSFLHDGRYDGTFLLHFSSRSFQRCFTWHYMWPEDLRTLFEHLYGNASSIYSLNFIIRFAVVRYNWNDVEIE